MEIGILANTVLPFEDISILYTKVTSYVCHFVFQHIQSIYVSISLSVSSLVACLIDKALYFLIVKIPVLNARFTYNNYTIFGEIFLSHFSIIELK